MKKLVLVIAMLVLFAVPVFGADPKDVGVTIDGKAVSFTDAKPFIDESGRTQVPVRTVMEAYGAKVAWDAKSKTAAIRMNDNEVDLVIGESYLTLNDKKIPMDTAATIVDGKTYLPIRPVIEALGGTVEWNVGNRVVVIERSKDQGKIFVESDLLSYNDFSHMFSYDTQTIGNEVWINASYSGGLGKTDFSQLWTSIPDSIKESYMKQLAADKQRNNPKLDVSIHFFFGDSDNIVDNSLGSSSCTKKGVTDAIVLNPFQKAK